MKMPSTKAVVINIASLVIVASAAGTQINAYFNPPQLASCPVRFAKAVRLGVERAGVLLTASDVQSVSAGADFGVMENLSVQKFKASPFASGFKVALAAGTAQPNRKQVKGGGVSFPWVPQALPEGIAAACLSYDVFIPEDFDFAGGGTLPGLFGASPSQGLAVGEKVDTRFVWSGNGKPRSHMMLSTKDKYVTDYTPEDGRGNLSRGRWVRIDQEVQLNEPGAANGHIRLWVDGAFRSETKHAELRYSSDMYLQGVKVDVHFGAQPHDGNGGEGRATKDEQIFLTPFELRWN
jgi:hypothetical protein